MNFDATYSLHDGDAEWRKRGLFDWLASIFTVPSILIAPSCTGAIRSHVQDELSSAGWSYDVRISPLHDITVTGMYRDLAFQIQTGNVSRAMYDLLKLEYLYREKRIKTAALALPTKSAADLIGSNIANVERLWSEVQLFSRIVTVPLLLVSFR